MSDILIFGSDKRQLALNEAFLKNNVKTQYIKNASFDTLEHYVKKSKIIVLPIIFTEDSIYITKTNILISDFLSLDLSDKLIFYGLVDKKTNEYFIEKKIKTFQLTEDVYFKKVNSILTVEATLKLMIESRDISIYNSNILITGYGFLSKELSKTLSFLGANVSVYLRNKSILEKNKNTNKIKFFNLSDIGENQEFDFVINTPNAFIFEKNLYDKYNKKTLFIDLASSPGGFNFDTSKFNNIIIARGLPSKFSYISAGNLIYETIIKILKEEREQL